MDDGGMQWWQTVGQQEEQEKADIEFVPGQKGDQKDKTPDKPTQKPTTQPAVSDGFDDDIPF